MLGHQVQRLGDGGGGLHGDGGRGHQLGGRFVGIGERGGDVLVAADQAAQAGEQAGMARLAAAAQQVAVGDDAQDAAVAVHHDGTAALAPFQRLHNFLQPRLGADRGHVGVHQLGDRASGVRLLFVRLCLGLVILDGAEDVEPADQADQVVVVVDHGQALETVAYHLGHHRAHLVAGAHGDHRRRHHVGGRGSGLAQGGKLVVQPLLRQGGLQAEARDEAGAPEQVAVGDDPHQGAAGVHHRQAAHAALQQQRDQLGDRRVGCDGYDIAAHDVADRLLQRVLAVAGGVLDDMDGLHDDQAVADHAPDAGQQLRHALGQIHPLDADGQVGGERLDVGGVDAAVRAVAGDGAGNRGAGSALAAQPLEDGGVEIGTVIAVAFADIDGDAGGLALHLHRNLRYVARLQLPGLESQLNRRPT